MLFDERQCRLCGCTDLDCTHCIETTGQPCFWVEEDLCSACAAQMTKARPNLENWTSGPALLGAYWKGWDSYSSKKCCPYRDKRNDMNRVTFSRAFIRTWYEGREDAARGLSRYSVAVSN